MKKTLKIFLDLKFAILLLLLIAGFSSIGTILEQDESPMFYEENYSKFNSKLILFFGLDHIYGSWFFLFLLGCLSFSLISCTFFRQFPLVRNSKNYFFQKSFENLPFFIQFQQYYFLKENFLVKLFSNDFFVYQKKDFIYAYKGLIGRISPILVHISLILILSSTSISSFLNFKSQEMLPKGEVFRIQNILKIGSVSQLPAVNTRVNDFWIEYKKEKISQFSSNLSLLDNYGNEILCQSISVNNPLKYKNIDFYQSDWNLIGVRQSNEKSIKEYPFFSFNPKQKSWITWIQTKNHNYSLVFDQLQNSFFLYNEKGNFLEKATINQLINNDLFLLEILPSTGFLIKYDPTISFIYFGFALLILTTFLSYLPYTQIWIGKKNYICIGSSTNRGKFQLELEIENFLRYGENILLKNFLG